MQSYVITFFLCAILTNCDINQKRNSDNLPVQVVQPGAYNLSSYLPILKNKRVGLVVNHTSMIEETHLLDSLLHLGIEVVKIFSPEHGFRGNKSAGEKIESGRDPISNIEIISLYGKYKKPSSEDLEDIEVVVFDIQDVGVRFYTYISTLSLVMEACAESEIGMIVLDRPNPNGYFIDGPVLDPKYSSFVGMHPVPIVYGMTIGEFAMMVNGERWITSHCDLKVVPCKAYQHDWVGELPIAPSPNLPNLKSILMYPSTCFFEATIVSEGRGTDAPFLNIGHPDFPNTSYQFVPQSNEGATYPKFEGKVCYGTNLARLEIDEIIDRKKIQLDILMDFYSSMSVAESFFDQPRFFDKLAGTDKLRNQIIEEKSDEKLIRQSWTEELESFKKIRSKYLIYP